MDAWVWMVPLHHGWDKTSPETNVPGNAYSLLTRERQPRTEVHNVLGAYKRPAQDLQV